MTKVEYLPLASAGWDDYALLDSGDKRKLEQFGLTLLDRFEPDANWEKRISPDKWAEASRKYIPHKSNLTGQWRINHGTPDEWTIDLDKLRIGLKLTSSRHVGIFPEQFENWRWLQAIIENAKQPMHILNLFAYTGISTLYCAQAGAQVTHVDASRSAIELAKKSQALSQLQDTPIRWIVDDALKFISREIRRKNVYDGIILDPPKFGRGPNGEIWKFEQSISQLLDLLKNLLSPTPVFLLLTAYNNELPDENLAKLVKQKISEIPGRIEFGPLIQIEKSAGRRLNQAVYVRHTFSK